MTEIEVLAEIRDALQENTRLLRILASPLVEEKLQRVIHKDEEWRVYCASDGSSSHAVAKSSSVSHQTVSNYWKAWAPLHILEETDTKGRYRHRYNVDGIVLEGITNGGNA